MRFHLYLQLKKVDNELEIRIILFRWTFNFLFEPPHDKTNKMACAPSEDSDQPGHPLSLIRGFACA